MSSYRPSPPCNRAINSSKTWSGLTIKRLMKRSLPYVSNSNTYETDASQHQISWLSLQRQTPTNNYLLSPPVQTPQVATIPNPTVSNTSEPNLKPTKPDVWNSTECDAKAFQSKVLNYLGFFSGTAFSKQVMFILSLTTHAKSQS